MLPRNFNTERKRQIDTLKIFNDNVAEIKENTEYQIEFMAGMNKMHLDVILCPEFPYEKPILMIRPQIIHPWVAENSSSIIAAPGLLNFTVHSDLGRVAQAIIRELEQKPPKLLEEASGNMNESELAMTPSPSFSVNSPIRPLSFPELQSLSIEELIDLKDSEDLQDKFLENLQPSIDQNKSIMELMNNIEELANYNLSKKSAMEDLKTSMMAKVEHIDQLKQNYETLKAQHAKLSSDYTPHSIMTKMSAMNVIADEECEQLGESFLRGEIDCDAFLKEYMIKRKIDHSRRACHERLSHQLSLFDKAAQ